MENILFEDNHLIAINKRSGEIVQGDKTGDKPLCDIIKDYLKEKMQKPGAAFLGVVHRIDRPVSGIVIFARTSKALVRMNELFKERKIKKTYWAVVKNSPPEQAGTLIHYLSTPPAPVSTRCSRSTRSWSTTPRRGWRRCAGSSS